MLRNLNEQQVYEEIDNIEKRYIDSLSQDDFKDMDLLGVQCRNSSDAGCATYFINDGRFELTENARYIIRKNILNELTPKVVRDILSMSTSDSDYKDNISLVLEAALESSKSFLTRVLKSALIYRYEAEVQKALQKLEVESLSKKANPHRRVTAQLQKLLHYNDTDKADFDFNKVFLPKSPEDTLSKGFENYVNDRLEYLLKEKQKTPDELAVYTITNYFNGLIDSEKSRINKILTKNNNEVNTTIFQSKDLLKGQTGILKYKTPMSTEYTFYQTAFGFWYVQRNDKSEHIIHEIYAISRDPIAVSVNKAKETSRRFALGVSPVWVANKMYLKK